MEKVPFYKWLPYLLVMAAVFYLIPPALKGTRFEDFALFIFTPACCLASGVIFGKINGWVWNYCIVVAVIFAPTLVLYFKQSDIHYIFEYGGLALMGSLIGYAFHRDKYSADGSYAFRRLNFKTEDLAREACNLLYDNGVKAECESYADGDSDSASARDLKRGVQFTVKVPLKKLSAAEDILKNASITYEVL